MMLSGLEIMEKKQEMCLQCQRCCQIMNFRVPALDAQGVVDFYKARGCSIDTSKVGIGYIIVEVPMPCPHLKESGCDIYDSRPSACSHYDGLGDPDRTFWCKWKELEDR